jgi:hypothetical protein
VQTHLLKNILKIGKFKKNLVAVLMVILGVSATI